MDKKNQEIPEKKVDVTHDEGEESEDDGFKTVQKAKPYKTIEVKENENDKRKEKSCQIM